MNDEAILATMVQRIVDGFHPLRVILFGSHARGTARADSDVDLLVVMPRLDNRRATTIAMRRALGDLPVCKDIVVTTPAEIDRKGDLVGNVLRPALHEGKILYDQP